MTLLLTRYKSKKELKAAVGERLYFDHTYDLFGEYTPTGFVTVAHRPAITRIGGREFFARVNMQNGYIRSVT